MPLLRREPRCFRLMGEISMNTTRIDSAGLEAMRRAGKDFYVLFSADWCGYCGSLKNELKDTRSDLKLFEIDISDEGHRAWEEYKIEVVPTVIFFKGGKEQSRKAASFRGLSLREITPLFGVR